MDAGRGQTHRMKSSNSALMACKEEGAKPKFNFGDKVQCRDKVIKPNKIIEIGCGGKEPTYFYGILSSKDPNVIAGFYNEDEIQLISRGTPSKRQEHLENCLNKVGIFRYHSENWELKDKEALKQLDGQKARIFAVRDGTHGNISLNLYEADEAPKQTGGMRSYFSEKDFQLYEEILKERNKLQKEFVDEMDRANLDF